MGPKAAALIARYEFGLLFRSLQGLGVWAVFLLTYALALSQAYSFNVLPQFATVARALAAMNALDLFLIPFAGLLLGYGAIAGELELGTAPFLASKPISRSWIVIGKFLGRALYLGLVWFVISLGALGWIFRTVWALRAEAGVSIAFWPILGSVEGAVIYPLSLLLLALSFLGIGLLLSAWASRASVALSLGLATYALLGIAWNALFSAGPSPRPGQIVLRLLSPFVAWLEWSNELLGRPAPWKGSYLLVIFSWIAGSVALAAWRFKRRDLA